MPKEQEPAEPDTAAAPAEAQPIARFGTSRRGYRPKEVDAFVLELEGIAEKLQTQVRQAKLDRETAKIIGAEPTPPGQPTARLTAQLHELEAAAQRGSRTMVSQAREESARIRSDAERESQRMVGEAQEDAKRSIEDAELFLQDAEAQAGTLLADVTKRRDDLLGGLQQMQERLLALLPDLERTLGSAEDGGGSPS